MLTTTRREIVNDYEVSQERQVRNFADYAYEEATENRFENRMEARPVEDYMSKSEIAQRLYGHEYNEFYEEDHNDENYSEIYDLIFNSYNQIAQANSKEEVVLICLKFQIKVMNLLGWGLDFSTCSVCQQELMDDSLFSFETGSFTCQCCTKNSFACVKINNKIRMFLDEISKTDITKETKYDSLVNMLVLEKCFNFMKKYISNISNKKTKIFDVLNSTTVV